MSNSPRPSLLIFTALLMCTACLEPGISGSSDTGQPDTSATASGFDHRAPGFEHTVEKTPEGDLVQRLTIDDVARLETELAKGTLELRPAQPFVAAYVLLSTTDFVEMQMTYQRVDGSWTEFAPVEVDESVFDGARLRLSLPEQAIAMRLHASRGADAITFMTTRHYSAPPAYFALHQDIPGSESDLPGFGSTGALTGDVISLTQGLAQEGRYQIPESVQALGDQQSVPYENATQRTRDMEGTLRLARYLRERFPRIQLIEGYNNRENTAGDGLSVHAAGRALDLFIRQDLTARAPHQADNDVGDEIANWLISNANSIGMTYLIWDRTKWSASQTYAPDNLRHGPYGGTHPHDDHLHIELSTDAGNLLTPFFMDATQNVVDPTTGMAETDPLDPTNLACISRVKASGVRQGDCVQGEKEWKDCEWYKCGDGGVLLPTSVDSCEQATFAKREGLQCMNPTSVEGGCYSRTLDQEIPLGECVQIEEGAIHCGPCSWMICRPNGMQCVNQTGGVGIEACGVQHTSMMCEEQLAGQDRIDHIGPERTNLLVVVLKWNEIADLDLAVREPSGTIVSYASSTVSPNDGSLDVENPSSPGYDKPAPYAEVAYWGNTTEEIAPGTYDILVTNNSTAQGSDFEILVERFDMNGERTEIHRHTGNARAHTGGHPTPVQGTGLSFTIE